MSVRVSRLAGIIALLCILVSSGMAIAQVGLASVTGTVTDSAGAVIPGVKVTITNTDSKVISTGVTDEAGIYAVRGLPIGPYTVTIEKTGFAIYRVPDITLIASQVLEINATLQPASVTNTITVTSTPQLLETQTADVGTTIESEAFNTIPLNVSGARDATNILYSNVPTMSGYEYQDHIAGSQSFSKAYMVDGVDVTAGIQGFVRTVGMDAVQEMQVQIGGIGSDVASTGGGAILMQMKSGTSKLHGSGFYYLQNEDLNANTWENSYFLAQCSSGNQSCLANYQRARDRFADGGASVGGPIWKKHTFLFGDWERYSSTNHTLNPLGATVPTGAMLDGDFSALLTQGTKSGPILDSSNQPVMNPCTGQPYQYGQIFDPAKWTSVNGVPCGVPLEGNIVPQGRISTQSQKLIALYKKYYAPTQPTIINNFPTNTAGFNVQTNFDVKLDQYLGQRHHLVFGYSRSAQVGGGTAGNGIGNYNGPFSNWYSEPVNSNTYRISEIITLSPTLVTTLSAGYVRLWTDDYPTVPTDPTEYGFPDAVAIPQIGFGGSNGIQESGIGSWLYAYYHLNAYHYQDTTTWLKGRHSFKFGGEWSAQQDDSASGGNIMNINFSSNTGGPIDNSLTPWVGSGFANFLLGDVFNASIATNNPNYGRRKSFDIFAGDDFKVNGRLLLTGGLRWDVTLPYHEKFGHWQQFSPVLNNPNWGSYPGAWQFAKGGGDSFETRNDFYQFAPNIGAAYKVTDRIAARGAYGLFYVPSNLNQNYGGVYQQNSLYIPVNQVNNYVSGSTAYNWDNGYPGMPVPYSRDQEQTIIPSTGSIDPDALHLGFTQNWNVGVEYEIAHNVLLSATYLGNKGTHLHDGNLAAYRNFPSWSTYSQLWSGGHLNDSVTNTGQAAAADVPYPYPGFSSYAWAAIAPYPQLATVGGELNIVGSPVGVSAFNALIVEVKTRNTHGLTMDMSYTLSRATGNVQGSSNWSANGGPTWGYGYQDVQEYSTARGYLLNYDQTHAVKGYANYGLPFGRNQRFLNGGPLLDTLVGGWTVGYHGQYNSGTPMGTVGATYGLPMWMGFRSNLAPGTHLGNRPAGKLDLNNLADSSNTAFDSHGFTDPAAGTLGNSPYIYSDWRTAGYADEDISLIKSFAVWPEHGVHAAIHADFFNAFNRHYFNSPDNGRNDQYFGQITGVSGNRVGQLSARIEW